MLLFVWGPWPDQGSYSVIFIIITPEIGEFFGCPFGGDFRMSMVQLEKLRLGFATSSYKIP